MKLYALLTFVLALPLFVRLLPETAEDSVSEPAASSTPVEPSAPPATPTKLAEKIVPAAPEKGAPVSDLPVEQSH